MKTSPTVPTPYQISTDIIDAQLKNYEERKGKFRRKFWDSPFIRQLKHFYASKIEGDGEKSGKEIYDYIRLLVRTGVGSKTLSQSIHTELCQDIYKSGQVSVDDMKTLRALEKKGIVTADDYELYLKRELGLRRSLGLAVSELLNAGLLSQKTYRVVSNHSDPYNVARALLFLNTGDSFWGLLTEANCRAIQQHPAPDLLADGMQLLSTTPVYRITQRDFNFLKDKVDPLSTARAMYYLQNSYRRLSNLLTPAHLQMIAKRTDISDFSQALKVLFEYHPKGNKYNHFLTLSTLELIKIHPSPIYLAKALVLLNRAGLYDSANVIKIKSHNNLLKLLPILEALVNQKKLTQSIFDYAVETTVSPSVVDILPSYPEMISHTSKEREENTLLPPAYELSCTVAPPPYMPRENSHETHFSHGVFFVWSVLSHFINQIVRALKNEKTAPTPVTNETRSRLTIE